MARPSFMGKVIKDVQKSIPGLSYGFNDPKTWLDTGCYALNYLMAGRFEGGIPLEGKSTMFAGDSGSGKSYICSANVIKDAQAKGVWPVLIDTENALDEEWMKALGVDTTEDGMTKYVASKVDDCAAFLSTLIENYKADNSSKPYDQRAKMLIIIDSMGMLITENQEKQFDEGDQKGDLGLKAKQVTNMMRVLTAKIASEPIGLVFSNHVYDSQDKYKPDAIPGGKMLEFATSIIVQMNKYLRKEDEFGDSVAEGKLQLADGIRSAMVVRKSRYSKPFEKVFVHIPYTSGMDKYSGLIDLFTMKGLLEKSGTRWQYTSRETGEVFTEFKRNLKESGVLDTIMNERELWEDNANPVGFSDMNNVMDPFHDPTKKV